MNLLAHNTRLSRIEMVHHLTIEFNGKQYDWTIVTAENQNGDKEVVARMKGSWRFDESMKLKGSEKKVMNKLINETLKIKTP